MTNPQTSSKPIRNNKKFKCCKCGNETIQEQRLSTGITKSVPNPRKLKPQTKSSIILNNMFSPPRKTYKTKLTSTVTFTDAIPCKSRHSGQLLGTILNTSNQPVRVTWDTGAGISMIERRHLYSNFSPLPQIHHEKGYDLSGIGNFALNKMTQYVSLPVRLVTDDGEIVTFECPKVWIVENYLVDGENVEEWEAEILIGNDFLRNHRLGIEWGERGTRDFLRYRGVEGEFLFPCLSHKESDGT